MEYITEEQANIIIDFVNNEIKKAKNSKIRGFSLKEISNIVYEHFNNNTLFRLFSIEYMKSKMGYKNNFNDLVVYNRQSFNAVINHTLTYNKRYYRNAYDINLLETYAKLTKNHISLVDINYKTNATIKKLENLFKNKILENGV